MKATLVLSDPDRLEATITLKASIGDFKHIRAKLKDAGGEWHYPTSALVEALEVVIRTSTEVFDHEVTRDQHGKAIDQ